DEISEEINELKNGIIQAKYITNKIKELFDNKTEVMYEENDEKKFRPIEYKDIAILYRGIGQDAKALFDELKNNNIPCVISKQDNFMDELDVKLTIAMLRVIDNPYDNVAYVTTLYSDLYKFNPEELMLLKKRNKYKVSFYQMIEEEIKLIQNNTSDLEINLINKIKNVNETYNHLKTFSIKNSLENLVKEIYDIFNKEKYFLGFMNMKNKVDNMNLFLTYAKKYEASGSKNIYDFIKTIKQIEETKKKVELTTPMETGNAITIMTIHKSKGLEFPIVFMPSLEKLFKKEDLNGKTLIEKELGYITKYIDTKKAYLKTNLFFETVREKLNEELIAEEMRIFYVAMTRAKEKLYMIGSYVESKTKGNIYLDMIKNNKIKYRDITTAISPLDFFMPCIYQSNTLDTEKNMIVVDERDFVPKDMNEEIKISPMRILFNEIKDEESKNKSITYDHIDATIVKQKVSVTEIKKRKMAEINLNEIDDKEIDEEMILESIKPDEEIYKPKSDILKQITRGDRNKLTPAEKGTLMHKLAKIINDKDIDKEFNRLIENNIFKKEELDQIDKEKIIMYLNSNTFERIDKSNFVKREMPFMMKKKASEIYKDKNIQDDVIIQGIVDCIFEEDNEIVILDYKTDKVFKEGITKEERINEIKNNYKVQLDLYEEAVSKIYNKPIKEKILYLFDSGDTVKY
ncbi:MAG: PD-(D/E)XK nuclease family protein, partial [Clostridia bacterium]|nr:PD-(D/E)XK nuclease family protein [Clostridia bacterium]